MSQFPTIVLGHLKGPQLPHYHLNIHLELRLSGLPRLGGFFFANLYLNFQAELPKKKVRRSQSY